MSKCRIVKADEGFEVQQWVPGFWDSDGEHFKTKNVAVAYAKAVSCQENRGAEYDVICVVEDGKIV